MLAVGIVGGHRIYIHQYHYTLVSVPLLAAAIVFVCLPSFFFRMLGILVALALVARWLVDGFTFAKFDFRKWQYKQYPVTHFEKRVFVTQGVLTREQAAELQSFDSFELIRNAHDDHDEKRRHVHWE